MERGERGESSCGERAEGGEFRWREGRVKVEREGSLGGERGELRWRGRDSLTIINKVLGALVACVNFTDKTIFTRRQ